MNLKVLLTHLKEDTPDEEECADAFQAKPSHDNINDLKKVAVNVDEDDQEYDETLPNVDLDTQPSASPRGIRSILSRTWSAICPSPSHEEEIQAYIPHYRVLPIISGITIPFCILLEIPGLTEHWYIRTDGHTVVAWKPNPPLLDIGIAISIFCAVLANICLVIRFLERRVRTMTILCTLLLSIHGKLTIKFSFMTLQQLCLDTINIIALAMYGGTKDGYTFGQAFWMTLCSTIVSMFTNVTLIIDLVRTPFFKRSGEFARLSLPCGQSLITRHRERTHPETKIIGHYHHWPILLHCARCSRQLAPP